MAAIPDKASPSTHGQQEWQVVYDVTPNYCDACQVMDEAAYSTLRRHAGPLQEPAVSVLQQSSRNLLQRKHVCSPKALASSGTMKARIADTNDKAASSSAEPHAATLSRTEGAGQDQNTPQSDDWEFI